MPTEPTPKIAIRDLYKSFGPKQVLKGVTLDVMPAESLVIIGGSGTGKSVLIKNILGLMKPDDALRALLSGYLQAKAQHMVAPVDGKVNLAARRSAHRAWLRV